MKKDGLYSGETINEVAWYLENSGNEPHKVGLKQPNELGIYDMFGNVWEWVDNPTCPNAKAHKIFGGLGIVKEEHARLDIIVIMLMILKVMTLDLELLWMLNNMG